MPSQGRKHRGYKTQDIVAQYLAENGFPYALSAGAGRTGSDITGTIGIDWEIKARRGFPVTEAMAQAMERLEDGDIPAIVLRPDGYGPSRIEQWPVIFPMKVAVWLLREAGFGSPNEQEEGEK